MTQICPLQLNESTSLESLRRWSVKDLTDDWPQENQRASIILHNQIKNLCLLVERYQERLNDVAVSPGQRGITAHTGPLDLPILKQVRAQHIVNADPKKPYYLRDQMRFAQALLAIAQKRTDWDTNDVAVLFDRDVTQHYAECVVGPLVELACEGRFEALTAERTPLLGPPPVHEMRKEEKAFWGEKANPSFVPTKSEALACFTTIDQQIGRNSANHVVPPGRGSQM